MKKLLTIVLVIALMASLFVGCAGKNAGSSADSTKANDQSAQKPEEKKEDKPEAKKEEKKPKYILRYGHVLTESDPYQKAFLEWSDKVKERTNGDVLIEVYHSAQLGVEEDIIEQMRQGANIGWNTDAARMGNYVKDIAVMNAPYFVDNLEEVEKLTKSKVVAEWNKKLAEKHGLKVLSFAYVQGYRNLFTNKPITSPADTKGLVFRSPGAPIWMEANKALGATPVAMPMSELYTGLQTKAVDGCGNTLTNANAQKLYEVVKYISETQHILLMNFSVVSADWFNSLPAEYQTIVEEECNAAGMKVSKEIETLAQQAKENLVKNGMTLVPHDKIDIAAFKAKSEEAYKALNLLDARNKVYEEIGKK